MSFGDKKPGPAIESDENFVARIISGTPEKIADSYKAAYFNAWSHVPQSPSYHGYGYSYNEKLPELPKDLGTRPIALERKDFDRLLFMAQKFLEAKGLMSKVKSFAEEVK